MQMPYELPLFHAKPKAFLFEIGGALATDEVNFYAIWVNIDIIPQNSPRIVAALIKRHRHIRHDIIELY